LVAEADYKLAGGGNMEEESKEVSDNIIKKLLIKKLLAFFLPILPFIIIAAIITVMIAVIFMPFMGIFGYASGGDSNMTKAALNFETKLEERMKYWANRDVEIDKSLLLAIIFYEARFDEVSIDCESENLSSCFSTEYDYNELAKEITPLADNMVEQRTIHYCSSETIEKKITCEKDAFGEPTSNCTETSTTVFEDFVACGSDINNCKNLCTGNYNTNSDTNYYLTSEEKYIAWLKANFLPSKLVRLGYEIPTDNTLKNEFYDEVIVKIFSIKSAISEEDSLVTFLGIPMHSYGEAGQIDPNLLALLSSPLGSQFCRQSACYGYYGIKNCATHNGVDIGANGGMPDIFSIFSGKVISITIGTTNCKPNFTTKPLCPAGCTPTIVLVEHSVVLNGVVEKFYSRYIHLDSIAPGIKVGAEVAKGQKIGVMGNTGCSTSTHLHFEMWNKDRKRHNPEELLLKVGCTMINTCEEARARCSS
jgi:hypothetical protein